MHRSAIKKCAFIFLVALVCLTSFASKPLFGQAKNSDEVALLLLKRLDKNRDGFLTAAEIPPRSRVAIASVAKNAGMKINAKKGISIEKLEKQLRKKQKANDKEKRKVPAKEKSRTNEIANQKKEKKLKSGRKKSNSKKHQKDETAEELDTPEEEAATKSFGKAEVTISTKGFGKPSATNDKTETESQKEESEANADTKKKTKKDKYGRFAASLMKRHDKNKSGVLEKNEWQKLGEGTEQFDLNGDDVLDEIELRAKLVGFSTNPNNSSSRLASKPTANPKRTKRNKSRKKTKRDPNGEPRSYRFKTAHERILSKVPNADWFVRLDRNKDGQIAMSEFAKKWTPSAAREFMDKDTNNDGIITPDELRDSAE